MGRQVPRWVLLMGRQVPRWVLLMGIDKYLGGFY